MQQAHRRSACRWRSAFAPRRLEGGEARWPVLRGAVYLDCLVVCSTRSTDGGAPRWSARTVVVGAGGARPLPGRVRHRVEALARRAEGRRLRLTPKAAAALGVPLARSSRAEAHVRRMRRSGSRSTSSLGCEAAASGRNLSCLRPAFSRARELLRAAAPRESRRALAARAARAAGCGPGAGAPPSPGSRTARAAPPPRPSAAVPARQLLAREAALRRVGGARRARAPRPRRASPPPQPDAPSASSRATPRAAAAAPPPPAAAAHRAPPPPRAPLAQLLRCRLRGLARARCLLVPALPPTVQQLALPRQRELALLHARLVRSERVVVPLERLAHPPQRLAHARAEGRHLDALLASRRRLGQRRRHLGRRPEQLGAQPQGGVLLGVPAVHAAQLRQLLLELRNLQATVRRCAAGCRRLGGGSVVARVSGWPARWAAARPGPGHQTTCEARPALARARASATDSVLRSSELRVAGQDPRKGSPCR